jgi:thiamine transport system ATP-binding protein
MLVLDNVAFAYPNGPAYRFSMTAGSGAVTAVTGASGAGKSTLLDLIAGFLTPAAGAITLDGRDLLPLPAERRPVSILFQSELVFEHLSAAANVALGLPREASRTEAAGHVGKALREVGLTGPATQRASTLSGGEKQRVALARTLLRNRPVLLLDEPFSALDDETRQTMRALVMQLTAEHGWHTILVSHAAADIAAMAAQTYRLKDGRLLGGRS